MLRGDMDKIFLRNFILLVLVLTVCSGGLIAYFIKGDRALEKVDYRVSHTHEVIAEAQELSARLKGMLAAQRGYLLTGDQGFLEEYREKKVEVGEHIIDLTDLTRENPSQQSRLEHLRDAYKEFSAKLEARTSQPVPYQNKDILDDVEVVNNLKEEIIKINNAVLDEEYRLLTLRIKILQSKKSNYLSTLIGGVIVGAILLLIVNSFLLRAKQKRSYAEASLKDSEDRFALALEGTQDGIFDWNIKNDKIFYSRRFFEMLDYEDMPRMGTPEMAWELIHPDDLEGTMAKVEQYVAGGLSEFSAEFRMKNKSGRWVWIQSRARGLFGKDGRAYRMVGAHTDITYLKAEQEKLESEKRRAEEANVAKSDFLAHMSHEIRTPLTAITGIAEILERNQINLDEKQRKLVRTLVGSTHSLKDLINDVLDFSKIEAGDLDLDEHVFDLDRVFAEVISMMSVKANEKGVSFVFDSKEIEGHEFFGDDARLRQIIVNLIGNAIKFTEAGGFVTVHPRFEERDGEDYLRIDVVDSGIGISAENFDLIFERFKQADSSVSRRFGGTGLGLPISRNLARLMGGDIFISSEVEKGSTFSLLLPVKGELKGKIVGPLEKKKINKKLSEKIKSSLDNTTRALIVEDYEGNVVVLSYILDELEIEYDVAENGRIALDKWKEGHYDFVLMDVQMPEMDGFAATAAIRKEEEGKQLDPTPIIGMTAHALVGDKDKCIAAGMDSYLPKPIVESDLKKEIFKHLKNKNKAA